MRLSPELAKPWVLALAIIVALSGAMSAAQAGILSSTTHALYYDSMSWKGTEHYAGNGIGTNKVAVDVDYAVFTRNGFLDFLDDNGLSHTNAALTAALAAKELIYAYQVYNVVAPTSPGVSNVQVGKQEFDVVGNVSPPSYVNTGVAGTVVLPGSTATTTSSMKWNYSANDIDLGEVSPILIFSSPKAPEWAEITVNSSTAADPDDVFVPSIGADDFVVPEPATLALAIWALALLLGGRKRVR